ncbi:hypothetical protein DMUE_0273 [Dictyocoela muelleri]|nr:hypothetical protein DMUE_0273 [Dictyocoela muelleri]
MPEELKLSINGGKFLHYDSGCLDPERLLICINSKKIMHLENSSIWLENGTFKMAPSGFFSDLHNLREDFRKLFSSIICNFINKTEKNIFKIFCYCGKIDQK